MPSELTHWEPEVQLELGREDVSVSQLEWKPNTHQIIVMIILSVTSCMVALDATIIVTTLNRIMDDFGSTATQGLWVGTAYLLATSVAMPILASLSNILGRPMLLIFSLIMFTLGSIICATSYDIVQLLAGRSVQGIGGGGIIVISLATFCDLVPLRQRPKWYGTIQGAWALGTCIGPVAGGLIAQHTTWRWIFYIMLPFCIFGLCAVPIVLTTRPRVDNIQSKLRRIDWFGSLVFMSSSTSLLIAISWGGIQFAWSGPATVVPLVIGGIGIGVTAAWERFAARELLMQYALFSSVSAIATYACSAAQGLLLFGQLYYTPFYFMSILAYSPAHTGVALLPVMLTLVPSSIATGITITHFNNYRWPLWAGWALCTTGCGLVTTWGTLIILGFGHGAILNSQNFASQAICDCGDEAAAAAMYAFMRHLGTALGVGIGGTTFQNVMASKLEQLGFTAEIARNAQGFLPELLSMPEGDSKHAIIAGYLFGFKGVFRLYLGISGLSFLGSLFIKAYDMNKELQTEHVLQSMSVFARAKTTM